MDELTRIRNYIADAYATHQLDLAFELEERYQDCYDAIHRSIKIHNTVVH